MATLVSGSVILNNITDHELARALDYKANHEKELKFDPTEMKPVPDEPGIYDHMVISWDDNDTRGYQVAQDLVDLMLLGTNQAAAQKA
jgi:hypothetical protein